MSLQKAFAHALLNLAVVLGLLSPVSASAQADRMGQWTTLTPDLPWFPVHTHLLPTGKVLLWPGDQRPGGTSGNDPRLWDPASPPSQTTLTPLARPGYNLFCSGHAFLPDGRLLVAGGHIDNDIGFRRVSLYDPFLNQWKLDVPDMNAGRWYPTVTALANGDALVVSGSIDSQTNTNTLPQVYQAGTNTWRNLTSAQLLQDLYPMMFLAPNGRVVNVGPTSTTRYLDTSGTGSWSSLTNRNFGIRDYGSAAMYADGKILLVGGGDPPTASAEVIDLNQATPRWRTVGSMSVARRQLNATLLPDGTVLATGGTFGPGFNNASTPVFMAELWNPATETWTQLASATVPRLYHSGAVLLPDGRVLTTGGNDFPTAEVFSPPYLFKGARPTMSGLPSAIDYGQRFTVQSADAASITKVTLIRLSSVTHAFDQNQRLNVLGFTPAANSLDIVAPANGNVAPPGHYLLFIVNGNGVPSVGGIVRLGSGPVEPPPSAPSASAWPPTTVPGTAIDPETIPVELGVKFRIDVSGFITGIRFYRGENHTGNYVVNLWTLGGQRLATASVGSVSVGWQQVNFSSPVAITANTVYVASYFAPNGRYAADTDYFATSGVDQPPIHLLQNGVSGGNGVFAQGSASSFPTQTFRSTNYWVDVSFTTSGGGGGTDTTPPTVTARNPVQGATGVDTSTVVSATFSEAMDPASLNANTFDLRIGGGSPIAATVTYDTGTRTATLRPSAALVSNTTYTATLLGGATDPRAKDVAGNALAASATWTFTTGAPSAPSASAWPPTTVPGTAIDPETIPVELGVKFRSDVSGSITGIRFYRGENRTGNYVVNLWTLGGQRLATANVGSVSVGWQQVNFSSPVAITANTVYVASYFAPNGRYAADTDYFATSGVDRPPLHLLPGSVSGGNGVYNASGASSFPTQTFRSTNYWVDVAFTQGGGGTDTTPPTVTASNPVQGATGVGTSTVVSATFSEAMDPASINGNTFDLRVGGGSPIAATVTYDPASNTARLTPSVALQPSTVYTATVRGGATDVAGNALAASATWTFTTGAGGGDTTPPTVTGRSPAPGATGVSASANIVVTFSEPMTTATLNGTTIVLSSAAGAVAATVTPGANNTATLDPTAPLAGNTLYTVTVRGGANGVKDAAGNAMTADVTWTFTTGTADTTPPTVSSTSPGTGATGVARGISVSVTFSEPMNPSTFTSTTFRLQGPQGAAVAGAITLSTDGRTATFNPFVNLARTTTYTATVLGGSAGVKDVAGNPLAATRTWTFTTR